MSSTVAVMMWRTCSIVMGVVVACGEPGTSEREEETATAPGDEYESPVDEPARGESRARTIYVPAYSHIDRGTRSTLLSITLSIRNVDPTASVTLTHVDYFDTSGHRVRRYLDAPILLRPLETAEFSVEATDEAGGSGANFLVYWEGPSDAHPLLTETVMVGPTNTGYVGFTSRGVELERRPALPVPDEPEPEPDTEPTGE